MENIDNTGKFKISQHNITETLCIEDYQIINVQLRGPKVKNDCVKNDVLSNTVKHLHKHN